MGIKVNGKGVKSRAKSVRNPLLDDERYVGDEPKWDTDRAKVMTPEEFDHHLRRSLRYYNYFYSQKDVRKRVVEWMKASTKFTVKELQAFDRGADRDIPMTVCSLIMATRVGMPLRDEHREYVITKIKHAISIAAPEVFLPETSNSKKTEAIRPTIQDRLAEKTAETIGELEGQYDEVDVGRPGAKPYEFLTANTVPQSQLGKFEQVYQDRRAELVLAQSGTDLQLTEGYKRYKTADFKRMIAYLDKILSDIDQYRNVKKATKKIKVKRPVSAEKRVARLKFAKDNKELKLVSINPADIIGAQSLWVYNCKTRKLGCYIADNLTGPLGVKGTGIVGYDEHNSVSKTLRKPAEKLKEFGKASKVDLRKFLSNIKATETKLNGRINKDMILLKIS